MHVDQQPYRTVYEAIRAYEGSDLHADVVRPWLRGQDGERRWLDAFARRRGSPVPDATIEDSWRLYALSRIVQMLQLHYTPASGADYRELMEHLGMHRVSAPEFHPFWHEIVSVDEAGDRAAPITVVSELWPAYALGPLLVTRAGCAVRAGADHLTRDIAERSILYWAYVRHNRPVADLSHGWGNNSQWRSRFRRDYALDGVFHYNVDGKPKRPPDEDLELSERLEMLRFRCFVKCTKPDEDRWPYDETWREES